MHDEDHTGETEVPLSPSADGTTPESLHTSNTMSRSPVAHTIADAFERKLREQRDQAAASHAGYSDFDDNHEKRQHFRRLIDPGIMRPNPRHIALNSLQVHDPRCL